MKHGYLALLIACAPAAPLPCDENAFPDDPTLQSILDEVTAAGVHGAVLLVKRGNQPAWIGKSGVSSTELGTPMQTCTPFPIASITKMIVATTVLSLVDDGTLSLDSDLRHQLAHTSGVPDYANTSEQGLRSLNDPGRAWTNDEALAFIQGMPLQFQPGTRFQYSNTNYVLLGKRVEAATGKTLGDVLRERVFDPAGMTHTAFGADSDERYLTNGYSDDTNTTAFRHPSRTPDGGLVSTAEDLGRFFAAWAHDRLLRPETRALMSEWTPNSELAGPGSAYGLGLYTTDNGRSVGHGGSSLRVFNTAQHYVAEDTTVVLLTNMSSKSNTPVDRALARIRDEVLP